MDGNEELLNYIHQNSEMGIGTIEHLLAFINDEELRKTLASQMDEYKTINIQAAEMLHNRKKEVKDVSTMSKISSNMMIDMKTLTDKSASHISEMLIQGNTMGIIQMTKRLNQYGNADKKIIDLANRLLAFEHRNIEECKKFLH